MATVVSVQLIEELESVLNRPAFRDLLGDENLSRFVAGLLAIAELADDPSPADEQISRDPDDDYLIALARVANVDALVSGDKDLLVLDGIGLPVRTPATFLARISDAGAL